MKKLVFLQLVLFFGMFVAESDAQQTKLYLKPSLNDAAASIRNNGSKSEVKSRIGYGIEMAVVQPLGERAFVSLGGGFNSRGYKNVRVWYFDVPLTINFLTRDMNLILGKQRLVFGAGVYGGLALSGKYKNVNSEWVKFKFGESAASNRSKLDGGLVFNLGTRFSGDEEVTFMLTAMFGLKNVIPADRVVNDDRMRLNTLQATVFLPISK